MDNQNYHRVVNFPNGYGASIICRVHDYGSWQCEINSGAKQGFFEVALLHQGEIHYGHPLNMEAIFSHLDFQGVADLLVKIEKLPKPATSKMSHPEIP